MLLGIYNIFVLLITVHLPQYWFVLHKHIGSCLCVLLLCADNELPLPVYYSAVELWIYQPPGQSQPYRVTRWIPRLEFLFVFSKKGICTRTHRAIGDSEAGDFFLAVTVLFLDWTHHNMHHERRTNKVAISLNTVNRSLWMPGCYCNPKCTHEKMALLKASTNKASWLAWSSSPHLLVTPT